MLLLSGYKKGIINVESQQSSEDEDFRQSEITQSTIGNYDSNLEGILEFYKTHNLKKRDKKVLSAILTKNPLAHLETLKTRETKSKSYKIKEEKESNERNDQDQTPISRPVSLVPKYEEFKQPLGLQRFQTTRTQKS